MKTAKKLLVTVMAFCLIVGLLAFGAAAQTENAVEVQYQRLILNDALTMRFDIAADGNDAVVNVIVAGETVLEGQKISQLPAGEEGCYQLNVDLAAAQLADDVTLELVDGESISTQTYRAVDYAGIILAGDYKAETKKLVEAMLHYGAAAQNYFDYNTENPANAGLTAEEVILPQWTQSNMASGSVAGVQFYGASLMCRSRVAIRFYFQAQSVEGIDFGGYAPEEKNGLYYVEIPGINPQDYDKEVTLTVTDGSGEMTVTYSPMAYILRKYASAENAKLKALTAAMYRYHLAAKAYAVNDDAIVDDNGIVIEQILLSGEKSSAVVAAGTQLDENVTTLTLSATPMAETGSDVTVGENEKMVSLDVHIAGISKENTVPVLVTLDELAPEFLNMGNIALYHVEDGMTVEMTRVYSAEELDVHNEYYYDVATGTVTVAMASFSEIVAVANEENLWNGNIDTTWYNAEQTAFEIFNADQLAGLGQLVDEGSTFEGKTVKMMANINLLGYETNDDGSIKMEDGEEVRISLDPIGYRYEYHADGKVFKGVFDGNGNTISNLYQNGWDLGYEYSAEGGGLFASVSDGAIRNLTMDKAYVVMECIDMGVVAGYAQGNCTFENIIVRNSTIANYQRYTGGAVGEVSNGHHIFKNVDVENTTTVSSLWGDFDASLGGILGGKWGHSYDNRYGKDGKRVTVEMINCDSAAVINAYNDVTSAYQWYSYRRCGMLVGNTEESETVNGRTEATASWLTTEDCTVSYGNWVNYTYCQFTNTTSLGARYPWVRVQGSEFNNSYSNPRYGRPTFADVESIDWTADHTMYHTEDDGHDVDITFNQLYGGGQGCYGGNSHIGNGVKVIDALTAAEKFTPNVNFNKAITNGATIKLGDLFTALDGDIPALQNLDVIAFVSPATEDDTVRATFYKHPSDWTQSTLTFTGSGYATITIQDYYYCIPTTLNVYIPEYTITDYQLLGQWVDNREEAGVDGYAPERSYDGSIFSRWNPQANAGFKSGEGIVYTLDKYYDLTEVKLIFTHMEHYFELYVSTDGVNYDQVCQVSAENIQNYYSNGNDSEYYLATVNNFEACGVRYIKLMFTGNSKTEELLWVNLNEILLTGKPTELPSIGITDHKIAGSWFDDRVWDNGTNNAELGPQLSYDGNLETMWNPGILEFTGEPSMTYYLDEASALDSLVITFTTRQVYFTLYTSTDGTTFTETAQITAANYKDYVCTVSDLKLEGVTAIKLVFTGKSDNNEWINFYEIELYTLPVGKLINNSN